MPRTNTFQACPYFSGSSRGWNGVKPHTCLMPYSRHINLFSQDEWSLDRRHSACLCKGGIEACFLYYFTLSPSLYLYVPHGRISPLRHRENIRSAVLWHFSGSLTHHDVRLGRCFYLLPWGALIVLEGEKKKRGVLRVWATVQTLERSGAVQLFLFLHVPPLKPDSGGFTLGGTKPSCTRQNNMPQHTDT